MLAEPLEDVGYGESLAAAFADVDLYLRLSHKGYRNVWAPNAELYRHESQRKYPR